MITSSEKYFCCGQKSIKVIFNSKVISIDCTPFIELTDIKEIYRCADELIEQLKACYTTIFNKELPIRNDSLKAEIWGHLLVYKWALWLQQRIKFSPIHRFLKFVAFRSGTIDCGTAKVDSNRWVWDLLAPLFVRQKNGQP